MKLSVIICTFNRADLLKKAIISLVEQEVSPDEWELIVVDNNSNDATKDVVSGFAGVRYVFEAKQGLSHARNRGLEEASGEYVAYVDDECQMSAQWVGNIISLIDTHRPKVFGGPIYPWYEGQKPVWFQDDYGSYSLPHNLDATGQPHISGGNMGFDAAALKEAGGFDPALGVSAGRVLYGEETAIIQKLKNAFGDSCVEYSENLANRHLVRPERFNWGWIMHENFKRGVSRAKMLRPQKIGGGNAADSLGGKIVFALWDLSFAVLFRDRTKYPHWQNFAHEVCMGYVRVLGLIWGKIFSTGASR